MSSSRLSFPAFPLFFPVFFQLAALGVCAGCSTLTAPPQPEPIAAEPPPQAATAAAIASAAPAPAPAPPAAANEKVKIEEVAPGKGAEAKSGDKVGVHYTGTLTDGKEFDSSRKRTPFEFTLGQPGVIEGWQQGIVGMKVGQKRKLTIPPSLAYGPAGRPPVIPPNSTLVFDVELMAINGQPAAAGAPGAPGAPVPAGAAKAAAPKPAEGAAKKK